MILRLTVVLTLSFFMGTQLMAMNEEEKNTDQTTGIVVPLPGPDLKLTVTSKSCSFCKIVEGVRTDNIGRKLRVFYNTGNYMAWLDNNPNTPGASLFIPKEHLTSKFEDVPVDKLIGFINAAQVVFKLLNDVLDTERTPFMSVGFQVDHLHWRLSPKKHPGKDKCIVSNERGDPAPDEDLDALEQRLIDYQLNS